MALLGLFSKRDKSKSSRSTTPSKSTASEADSTEAEYVLPNARNTPQAHNGFYSNPAASSSKIRLGFGHKKSSPIVMADSPRLQPPLMHSPSSALSEGDLDHLRPPLSKSALFSAYSDPQGAHSTRSLPSKPLHSRNNSRDIAQSVDGHSNNDPPNTEKDRKGRNDKKGGFLAWARGRSKSRPPPPPPELTVDLSAESFNLKSFRHVGSDSPAVEVPRPPSALSSPFNTPPVRPRPRGNSVASDTSQRISVAAFREMAARQRPNSPSPVLRPPSRTELSSRYDNSSPSPVAGRRPGIPSPATRSSTALASQSDTTSDEDSDSEESESEESGGSATLRPKRSRTITQRSASKATSELGHRSRTSTATPTRGARSNMGHGNDISTISPAISPPASAPRESRSGSTVSRNRASASMSALQPSAAARRASLRVAARAPIPVSRPSMAQSSSSSSDSDSDDSDNAPLSRLVAPKRPGSAASSATTGSRVRMPAKPLIDITGMNAPTLPPLPSFETSAPSSAPEKQEKTPSSPTSPTSPTSFTSDKPTLADRLARIAQGQKSKENLTGGGSSERRSLDYLNFTNNDKEADEKPAPVPQPTRSQTAPMGSLEPSPVSSSAPMRFSRKFKPNGRSLSSPNAAAPVDLADPKPIHPIPIRERSPPPAFSVTSRPISQTSNPSSPRLSASFNTDSIPTIRAIGVSSPPSSPDRSKMPAPTSALTPRNNPTLRNPPPRISSMNANNVLIPETTKPTAKGFTGGGLLSTPAAVPKDPKSRGTRQRSSTMFDTASPAIASLGDNNSPVYSRSSRNLNTLIPSPSSGVPAS
ncbi:hypothetical protein QCA50_002406 [Cerrena zonata]|uniref:Uncharacterized protein n=1 Tax=Cerrena zonata TaxID=2478898 RepID=A0AAW0GRE5_9APHY